MAIIPIRVVKMKNKILLIIIAFVIIISGCKVTVGEKDNLAQGLETLNSTDAKISDYYPFLKNTLMDYKVEGLEYAEQTVYYEFIEGNLAQQKIINSGTNLVRILENKDGSLTEIYAEGEFYHIENMLNSKNNRANVILKEPLAIGNSWFTTDGHKKEITGMDVTIETPYKTFTALEVTTEYDDDYVQKDFYARGIGFVARIVDFGDHKVKTLLKSINEQPLEQDLQVFYPKLSDVSTAYIDDRLLFYTNQSIEKLIEEKLQNSPSEELIAPITSETEINSVYLDRNSWVLNVDFSEELLTDLNAGSSFEYEIIRSIVNTLGKYYDTEKVFISVNGKPYESGHIFLDENDYFTVDLEGIEKYK